MTQNKALGKGLSALIPPRDVVFVKDSTEKVIKIPVTQIKTNKYQPRLEFNREKLNDLINSIKEKGIIQPVLVRRMIDGYELIAGERRLRAAKNLNIEDIPAIIKDVSDVDMLEISLIENIQREGLNPIEEAKAYERFISEFNFTQEKIAKAVGKDHSTISNTIKLLTLPQKIQDFISKGSISAGHAKAILSIPTENDRLRVANLVVAKGFSVRETEKLVSKRVSGRSGKKEAKRDGAIEEIAGRMQQALGTRVKIFHGTKCGAIHIEYYSVDDLNRIVDIITSKKA